MSVLDAFGPGGDPGEALVLADQALEGGDDRLAAAALDRAWGLAPHDSRVEAQRREVLDRLEVREHGLVWRYVPTGTYLMGSEHGDPDERPVHPVRVEGFWMMDAPMTWDDDSRLRGWVDGSPEPEPEGWNGFQHMNFDKLRNHYSLRGRPMVAVGWQDAESLARDLSGGSVWYGLPTEAEWEKAARGGRIGSRYPWGDGTPDPGDIDCDRFGSFEIADPTSLRPNGYGLHGMCGTVWEWTADWYDALAYRGLPDPRFAGSARGGPDSPDLEVLRAIRGGSWADSLAACTVSFRASMGSTPMGVEDWGDHMTPTVGYRLARYDRMPAHVRATLVPVTRR
ncbi:MAG: SUMF1/EgtB/PvdO family nonheme iron enzyme [Myxococcota bacterium]